MTLEEAKEIVAKLREDDTLYISGPHEYGPSVSRKWNLDGAFSARDLEAMAIVFREHS